MVKEQKGRIEELVRSKQESVAQLKVSGWCVYSANRLLIDLCLCTMTCDYFSL